MTVPGVGALLALTLSSFTGTDAGPDRLYGRVHLRSGEVHVGYLRWDRNEASWTDFLDGVKELPPEYLREAERLDPELAARLAAERSIVAFGVRITWDEDDESGPLGVRSAIRFGHLASLERVDDRSARLVLRSGGEVMLRTSSSDLGSGMRPLVIERGPDETTSVRWRELERVEFIDPPSGVAPPAAERLRGTLTTRNGHEFTGCVSWDIDEVLTDDILDGRLRGRDHEIPFGEISEIAWHSDRSARVVLDTGEELTLRGTNDVDRTNRGIEVSDAGFGRVTVQWEDFGSVRFGGDVVGTRPDFDPDAPITGTVYARDGRVLTGDIRWGNDESRLWESLGGWADDARLEIEFGALRMVERIESGGARATLRDGRVFELEDDEDVDERNQGLFVRPEGRALRLVRWRDVDRVEFEHPRG